LSKRKDIKLGNFIKSRREYLSITQQDVADYVGVTKSAVSRWESGEIGNADIFFENTSALDTDKDNEKDTIKDTNNDSERDNIQDSSKSDTHHTNKDTIQHKDKDTTLDTELDTTLDTTQYTNKYTIEMPDTSELYDERLVANVTRSQKKYVERTAKKHKMNNSEFVRFMIDFFIENFELK